MARLFSDVQTVSRGSLNETNTGPARDEERIPRGPSAGAYE